MDRLENHYLDTADGVLVSQRVLLRIRRADRYILGLKIGAEPRPGFFDSIEIETEIAPEVARRVLAKPGEVYRLDAPPIAALRERFEVLPLEALGCLTVERTTKSISGRWLEFDRLVFPDGSERFELEIETHRPKTDARWLRETLEDLGVPVEPQRRTKLEQFVEWRRGTKGPSRTKGP